MSQSQIDVDSATVTRTVHIAAPRPLVWAALTTPEQIAQWFGQRADFPDGVALGAVGAFGWHGEGDFPARIDAYEPMDTFAFTWGTPGEELRIDNATTATFTLADGPDGGTALTVVESGFDSLSGDELRRRAAMADNAEGWNSELDELTTYVTSLQSGRTAVADLETGTITHTVLIEADAETTWRALTAPAAIEAWWGHPAVFPDGIAAGSLGTFEFVGEGLFPILIERVEPVGPTATFQFRWGEIGESEPGPEATTVRFTVVPAGPSRSLVTVVESGFAAYKTDLAERRAAMEANSGGWNQVLAGLVSFVQDSFVQGRP